MKRFTNDTIRLEARVLLEEHETFDYTDGDTTVVITHVAASCYAAGHSILFWGDGVVRRKDGTVGKAPRTAIYLSHDNVPAWIQTSILFGLEEAGKRAALNLTNLQRTIDAHIPTELNVDITVEA